MEDARVEDACTAIARILEKMCVERREAGDISRETITNYLIATLSGVFAVN